jgi:hypothetical protein
MFEVLNTSGVGEEIYLKKLPDKDKEIRVGQNIPFTDPRETSGSSLINLHIA